MAIPKVFVSSTCYDLKYIRENLKYFINNIGFEAVLSECGDVFYDPKIHTHDSCLHEVANCQLFVLIIGGRYGGAFHDENKSITNKEYEEAINLKIPVFTLVEQSVWAEHFVYQKNRRNPKAKDVIYPSVDNIKIFEFIDEVRKRNSNNAIVPFADFSGIEVYLKKQWAGMMYNFLTISSETKKVSELFEEIHLATEKIEYYTKQVAANVGDKATNLLINCYEIMMESKAVSDLEGWGIKVNPYMVLKNSTLDEICGNSIKIDENEEKADSLTYGGPPYRCTRIRKERLERNYQDIRSRLLEIIEQKGYTVEEFLNNEQVK